jgi:hypothetical protein
VLASRKSAVTSFVCRVVLDCVQYVEYNQATCRLEWANVNIKTECCEIRQIFHVLVQKVVK